MAVTIGQLIRNNAVDKDFNPLPSIDSTYGPYLSIQDANSKIHVQNRSLGLTVGIIQNSLIEEYWYKAGIEDINLVKKTISKLSQLNKDINYITVEEMYNHMIQMSYGIRKSYETLDLAKQDINPEDLETSKPLEVGQLVSVVSDTDASNNAIYRLASISEDGTPTWEKQAPLGDMSQYAKSGGSTKTAKDLEDGLAQLAGGLDDRIVELESHKNPMVVMTENEYDALEIKDPDTYYLIIED